MNTRMLTLGAGLIVLALGVVVFVILGPRGGTEPTRELVQIEYRQGRSLEPRTVRVRQGDTVSLGSILIPSISNIGAPHCVGTSLISEPEKRATG